MLAKGYLGFTLALILIAFFVSWLSDSYFDWLSRIPDMEAFVRDKDMQQGNYEDVPVGKYLGKERGFAAVFWGSFTWKSSWKGLKENLTWR